MEQPLDSDKGYPNIYKIINFGHQQCLKTILKENLNFPQIFGFPRFRNDIRLLNKNSTTDAILCV